MRLNVCDLFCHVVTIDVGSEGCEKLFLLLQRTLQLDRGVRPSFRT